VDLDQVDFHVIVSDSREAKEWKTFELMLEDCGETFGRFKVPTKNMHARNPKINVINLYDILPPVFKNSSNIFSNDTSALLTTHNKYIYQSIKKMAAALHLDYDYALWLDSEAIAVQPFSFRRVFDVFVEAPVVWRSRATNNDFMRGLMRNTAHTLGRSIESFGSAAWMLESLEWIIEKDIFVDMVRYIEAAHDGEFWNIWLKHGGPFEVLMYTMHIYTRKLETVDTIFSKYQVLETEREMIRYGLGTSLYPNAWFRME
jgi:hypothetical protein